MKLPRKLLDAVKIFRLILVKDISTNNFDEQKTLEELQSYLERKYPEIIAHKKSKNPNYEDCGQGVPLATYLDNMTTADKDKGSDPKHIKFLARLNEQSEEQYNQYSLLHKLISYLNIFRITKFDKYISKDVSEKFLELALVLFDNSKNDRQSDKKDSKSEKASIDNLLVIDSLRLLLALSIFFFLFKEESKSKDIVPQEKDQSKRNSTKPDQSSDLIANTKSIVFNLLEFLLQKYTYYKDEEKTEHEYSLCLMNYLDDIFEKFSKFNKNDSKLKGLARLQEDQHKKIMNAMPDLALTVKLDDMMDICKNLELSKAKDLEKFEGFVLDNDELLPFCIDRQKIIAFAAFKYYSFPFVNLVIINNDLITLERFKAILSNQFLTLLEILKKSDRNSTKEIKFSQYSYYINDKLPEEILAIFKKIDDAIQEKATDEEIPAYQEIIKDVWGKVFAVFESMDILSPEAKEQATDDYTNYKKSLEPEEKLEAIAGGSSVVDTSFTSAEAEASTAALSATATTKPVETSATAASAAAVTTTDAKPSDVTTTNTVAASAAKPLAAPVSSSAAAQLVETSANVAASTGATKRTAKRVTKEASSTTVVATVTPTSLSTSASAVTIASKQGESTSVSSSAAAQLVETSANVAVSTGATKRIAKRTAKRVTKEASSTTVVATVTPTSLSTSASAVTIASKQGESTSVSSSVAAQLVETSANVAASTGATKRTTKRVTKEASSTTVAAIVTPVASGIIATPPSSSTLEAAKATSTFAISSKQEASATSSSSVSAKTMGYATVASSTPAVTIRTTKKVVKSAASSSTYTASLSTTTVNKTADTTKTSVATTAATKPALAAKKDATNAASSTQVATATATKETSSLSFSAAATKTSYASVVTTKSTNRPASSSTTNTAVAKPFATPASSSAAEVQPVKTSATAAATPTAALASSSISPGAPIVPTTSSSATSSKVSSDEPSSSTTTVTTTTAATTISSEQEEAPLSSSSSSSSAAEVQPVKTSATEAATLTAALASSSISPVAPIVPTTSSSATSSKVSSDEPSSSTTTVTTTTADTTISSEQKTSADSSFYTADLSTTSVATDSKTLSTEQNSNQTDPNPADRREEPIKYKDYTIPKECHVYRQHFPDQNRYLLSTEDFGELQTVNIYYHSLDDELKFQTKNWSFYVKISDIFTGHLEESSLYMFVLAHTNLESRHYDFYTDNYPKVNNISNTPHNFGPHVPPPAATKPAAPFLKDDQVVQLYKNPKYNLEINYNEESKSLNIKGLDVNDQVKELKDIKFTDANDIINELQEYSQLFSKFRVDTKILTQLKDKLIVLKIPNLDLENLVKIDDESEKKLFKNILNSLVQNLAFKNQTSSEQVESTNTSTSTSETELAAAQEDLFTNISSSTPGGAITAFAEQVASSATSDTNSKTFKFDPEAEAFVSSDFNNTLNIPTQPNPYTNHTNNISNITASGYIANASYSATNVAAATAASKANDAATSDNAFNSNPLGRFQPASYTMNNSRFGQQSFQDFNQQNENSRMVAMPGFNPRYNPLYQGHQTAYPGPTNQSRHYPHGIGYARPSMNNSGNHGIRAAQVGNKNRHRPSAQPDLVQVQTLPVPPAPARPEPLAQTQAQDQSIPQARPVPKPRPKPAIKAQPEPLAQTQAQDQSIFQARPVPEPADQVQAVPPAPESARPVSRPRTIPVPVPTAPYLVQDVPIAQAQPEPLAQTQAQTPVQVNVQVQILPQPDVGGHTTNMPRTNITEVSIGNVKVTITINY